MSSRSDMIRPLPGCGFGSRRRPHGATFSRRDAGFTLVEMVIVIILVGILFGFGSVILSKVFSSYAFKQDVTDADWQAKVALERMARELRAVRSATAADLAVSASEIRFVDIDGNNVCFYLNGTTLTRAEDGPAAAACGATNPQPLADHIGSFNLTYWQSNGTAASGATNVYYITAALTVVEDNVYNAAFRTNVRPRNF